MITDQRLERLAAVAAARQNMTVILENVHDRHNIGAVMRTCDAVGIQEIYVLYTEEQLQERHLQDVKSTSTGVRKWLDVHFYTEVGPCFEAVRARYAHIYATHLDADAKNLYDLDLSSSVALLLSLIHI